MHCSVRVVGAVTGDMKLGDTPCRAVQTRQPWALPFVRGPAAWKRYCRFVRSQVSSSVAPVVAAATVATGGVATEGWQHFAFASAWPATRHSDEATFVDAATVGATVDWPLPNGGYPVERREWTVNGRNQITSRFEKRLILT